MKMTRHGLLRAAICAWFCVAVAARADVKLPTIFSDHMVLQRDRAVPVWGSAAPGEKITVKFRGQEKSATADSDGKWMVKLDSLSAGGPDQLVVSGSNTVTISDVLVGEVWVGSGQSNMGTTAHGYAKAEDSEMAAAIAAAPYPQLRLSNSGRPWQEATADRINGFSALLFAYGLRLQKELNVPVGLIVGAVGGTPSVNWLSPEALQADGPCQELIRNYAAGYGELEKKYEGDLAKWEKLAAAAKEKGEREPKRPREPAKPGQPTKGGVGNLYAEHIRQFIPYAIRGVLWDQGEAGTALGGVDQTTLMGALIRGWRREWGQGDFPFIYVQKPSGGGCAWDPANPDTRLADKFEPLPATVPGDGAYVETHVRIMEYPNTAMAIASDLGGGIHPKNKSGYGHRAATVALGMVYGRKIEYEGPMYASHSIEGGSVRVRFRHIGPGLAFRPGDKLQGFAVAGSDQKFHWAEAKIDGDTVVVSSGQVPQPVAVRYAWARRRPWANLFSQDGLPAIPFRTDRW